MYSLRRKLYTNYTLNLAQNPTQRAFRTLHSERSKPYTASVQNPTQRAFAKLYTKRNTNPTFCFWTRISRMERMNANESSVTNVTNVKQEMAIGGEQPFPHPRRFFGFNTSCFWRWKVLYLYRDMGGASAPPFFRHFPFKIGDFRSASGKNLPSSNFNLPSSSFN